MPGWAQWGRGSGNGVPWSLHHGRHLRVPEYLFGSTNSEKEEEKAQRTLKEVEAIEEIPFKLSQMHCCYSIAWLLFDFGD